MARKKRQSLVSSRKQLLARRRVDNGVKRAEWAQDSFCLLSGQLCKLKHYGESWVAQSAFRRSNAGKIISSGIYNFRRLVLMLVAVRVASSCH